MSVINPLNPLPVQSSIVAAITPTSTPANTETVLNKLLVGGSVSAGDVYLIEGNGIMTPGGAGRTSTFTIRLGTNGSTADTSVGTVGPITGATGTNIPFYFKILVTFRTVGTTGTVLVNGVINNQGTTGIANTNNFISGNTTASTVNTTTNNFLDISYQTNTAGTSTTFQQVTMYKVR